MGYKVKYDIGTAVSIGLVVSQNPDGSDLEQEVVFLPGAQLPGNISPRLLRQFADGDPHLHSLIQEDDSAPAPIRVPDPAEVVAADELSDESAPNPFGQIAPANSGTISEKVDYSEWKKAALEAEVTKRTQAGRPIEVAGSGANGGVVAADLIKALEQDDTLYTPTS